MHSESALQTAISNTTGIYLNVEPQLGNDIFLPVYQQKQMFYAIFQIKLNSQPLDGNIANVTMQRILIVTQKYCVIFTLELWSEMLDKYTCDLQSG